MRPYPPPLSGGRGLVLLLNHARGGGGVGMLCIYIYVYIDPDRLIFIYIYQYQFIKYILYIYVNCHTVETASASSKGTSNWTFVISSSKTHGFPQIGFPARLSLNRRRCLAIQLW